MENITDTRNPVPGNMPRLPQLNALTSIRFFAALHVALFHMVRPFSLWGPFAPVFSAGYTGVSFFFLLSGFILTYSHAGEYERGNADPVRFWVARFARIYPVYLFSMIVIGYLGRALFRQPIHIVAYVADLLMIQSWSVRMVNFFNIPAWSLSVEMFFYVVFPYLLLRLKPRTSRRALFSVLGYWVLAMAIPLLCLHFYPGPSWDPSIMPAPPGTLQVFRVTRLPLLALPEFLAGVSLGWIFLRFPPSRRASLAMVLGGMALLAAAMFGSNHLPNVLLHNGLLIPCYSLIILGLSQSNWITRLFSAKPLILLGEASFALYLIHFMFNDWSMHEAGFKFDIPYAMLKLAIVIPISIALHLFIERPGRRIILKWWTSHHPVSPTVSRAYSAQQT